MGRTVHITAKQLPRELRRLARDMDRAVRKAAIKASKAGVALAAQASPRSSNTLALSWRSRRTKTGAVVASSAKHAFFVEEGRRPGKPPPVAEILEWVKNKNLAVGVEPYKKKRRKGKRRRTKRQRLKMAKFALALRIARKIGRVGTDGKYVLRGTIPAVGARFRRYAFAEIDRVMSS